MIDSYRHKGLRKQLVDEIRARGIRDERVLSALFAVPRHFFMDSSFTEFAYQDKPFPIGSGQTISQPYTVAFQSELLAVDKGDKVLEIGTGSGYQACVLLEMGARVYSIERHLALHKKTRELMDRMKYAPKLFYGDGYLGLPTYAPFDRILITAAVPEIPPVLMQQLKTGGIMVLPLGGGQTQTMIRILKTGEQLWEQEEHGYFRFVPMLKNRAK